MSFDTSTEKKKKTVYKYVNDYQKKKYDRITIIRNAGEKEKIEEIAKRKGLSMSQFINTCIDEKIKRLKIDM